MKDEKIRIRTRYIGGEQRYLTVDKASLTKAGLYSFEILCSSPLMKNMPDNEIARAYRKSKDYDANYLKMNVFVNGSCLQFLFDLFGLRVSFDCYQNRLSDSDRMGEMIDIYSIVVKSVARWFAGHSIDEISEFLYKRAEREVAKQCIKDLVEHTSKHGRK